MRRYGRVAGGVLAGCLVAGCSGLPGMDPAAWQGAETPSATPSPTTSGTQKTPEPSASAPALTAESVIKEYIERNNKANKALDEKLLATYEGGSSLAIDKAGYTSQRKLGGRDSYTPFEYVKPTFVAPASKRWFLATAYWKNKKKSAKTPTFLLFAHDQGAWKQVYSPDVSDTIDADELPKIQTDASGAATEVDSADGDGLLMSPADFAKNYAAHMTGKGSKAAKSRFASDQFTTGAAKNRIKMRQFAKITEHAAPAKEYPSYALRTADGGALVFTTFARTKVYDVIQSPKRYYVFQENNGLLPDKYYKFLKVGDLVQVAAHIPPKTASPAQVQVLGTYSGIVAGRGA
ncbi:MULTISPECIES: hypothetical protein [Nonomuraea]|uniref:DUF8094 domain-containing protein n=1 Tax=Nonomuraea salmonea TaxID=46181 RepID=A0ABV5NRL7_9ACTN